MSAEGSRQPDSLTMRGRCWLRETERDWTNIGRDSDGMAEVDVQQSLALRPPHHITSYIRLAPRSNKGISNTVLCTLIFLVLEGEVNVVINSTLLTVRKGDNFYVPAETTYSILNLSEERVELYLVQYKYVDIMSKQTIKL